MGFSISEVFRISAANAAIMLAVMGAASIGVYGVAFLAIVAVASGLCIEFLYWGIGALLRRAQNSK